ncbi:hypothetical protein [uncultured Aliiroseovarius sp.]|uniref:hypothetical protein n=1 Tax=uncultured Aliiroseovarius sp. TaxID=1658783 RepID=UPI0025975809|nr:hypothetical protein [uncultured Aliiroseovarius sp.]
MFKMISFTCYLAFSVLATSAAHAQQNVACTYGTPKAWDEISLMYVGPWKIAHHAGYVIAGPMTMPFPASGDIETIQIEMSPSGGLVGTHPEAQQPIVFDWADEPPWKFEADASRDGVPAPMLSSSDVEILMGCSVDKLARLIGRTQATIDGTTMDMTVRLMVVGPDQMYGIFHTSSVARGIPVKSWRTVTLTR